MILYDKACSTAVSQSSSSLFLGWKKSNRQTDSVDKAGQIMLIKESPYLVGWD